MNTKPLLFSLALVASAQFLPTTLQADILSVAPQAQVLKKANTPKHGESMRTISKKYGKASRIKTSKGKATKRNPKITQWVYSGFTVYFENSHVIHSVVHH